MKVRCWKAMSPKRETKKQLKSSLRKPCGAMEHQTRSLQISLGPTVQQPENWAIRISSLLSDGQTTELRIHIYHFDDEKGPCFDFDECTVYRSSPQSMPRFTIFSTLKGHSQNAVHSN
jgi:hypothetical protein